MFRWVLDGVWVVLHFSCFFPTFLINVSLCFYLGCSMLLEGFYDGLSVDVDGFTKVFERWLVVLHWIVMVFQ